MTRPVAFALLLVMIALGLINIALLEAKPANAGLPLVAPLIARPPTPTVASPRPAVGLAGAAHKNADFPLCVTIRPAPLLRTTGGRADFRLGQPSNDRGDT